MRCCPSLNPIPVLALAALLGGQAARAEVTVTVIVPNTAITGSEPVPLRAQVAGSPDPRVTWKLESPNLGEVTLDAAGSWRYQPPQHREAFLNVQLRATANAAPASSAVATLVLMPTNTLWGVINGTLNGEQAPPARGDQATVVGGKRKAGAACEDAEQAAAKRQLGAAGALAAAPARQKWQPASWMQANGNTHFENHPYWRMEPHERSRCVPHLLPKPFARGRAGAVFNQPTFLACVIPSGFVVSDTGNQVIRQVDGDQVRTLAGVAGQAGYRDGPAEQALFHTPQGLCAGPDGTVLVADQGNQVIRQITKGVVSTLAGLAGTAGTEDGVGGQARFTQLKGLACMGQHLLVVDGHAVRWINLTTRKVTTLCGRVDEPGFAPHGAPALVQGVPVTRPCLRNPRDLMVYGRSLIVADEGNHCLQKIRTYDGFWSVVAGDPGRPELGYGLCRDGLPGPLPPTVATLAAPKGIAFLPVGGLLVSTGRSIAVLPYEVAPLLALPRVRFEPVAKAQVAVGEPCAVTFTLASAQLLGAGFGQETEAQAAARREALPLLMEYELEFRNGDGTLASRTQGTCAKGEPQFAQGSFSSPGKGRVLFRGRTHQGVGAFAEGGDLDFEVK